jgi:hypothetical protein
VLPKAILINEQRQMLVLESLTDGPGWPSERDLVPVTSGDLARQVGAAMADGTSGLSVTEDSLWAEPGVSCSDARESWSVCGGGGS